MFDLNNNIDDNICSNSTAKLLCNKGNVFNCIKAQETISWCVKTSFRPKFLFQYDCFFMKNFRSISFDVKNKFLALKLTNTVDQVYECGCG